MRILSLCLPTLPTDRIARRAPEPTDGPLVTIVKIKGAQRVAAVNNQAMVLAVKPGMGLADARAVCPSLQVAEADPDGEAEALGHILQWCRRFTPLAALDPPEGLLLDVTGAAHLFGGEPGLVDSVETGLARQGWVARAAIADTPEAAWALARFSTCRSAPTGPAAIRILTEPLPLAALHLAPSVIEALAQAGLRRIGDVTIRPRAPIAARFGQSLFLRLDGLLGLTKSAITPSLAVPAFLAERRYMTGITRIEAVERAILSLAHHLCDQLTRAGQGARRIEALFFRVDGVVKRIVVGTSRPLRDPPRLARLFREKLATLGEDGLDTGYGFDLIRLAAEAVEPFGRQQGDLDPAGGTDAAREADLALLVDRLGARLGVSRVVRLHDANHHRPEAATTEVPALRSAGPQGDASVDNLDPGRPLRLFNRPEPIEAMAAVPDGPPARFRWRRFLHEIAAIEGPERIAAPWWTDAAPVRDYFQAEDGEGRRFWLFREGFYQTNVDKPRWFLHGLFG